MADFMEDDALEIVLDVRRRRRQRVRGGVDRKVGVPNGAVAVVGDRRRCERPVDAAVGPEIIAKNTIFTFGPFVFAWGSLQETGSFGVTNAIDGFLPSGQVASCQLAKAFASGPTVSSGGRKRVSALSVAKETQDVGQTSGFPFVEHPFPGLCRGGRSSFGRRPPPPEGCRRGQRPREPRRA
ncbi:hypothetical protein OUZ56_033085 [Daphnia magna]|uniref:Uncharacterized protein n=1 Tax=Daphnia magna TaxID=35525 RepID=A0ABR0BA55_9CRUS|nr:hypothetical protein OUZ56_033085 [Daphnia magna]